MWRAPKLHLAAGAFIASEVPLETIFMTMLLEQYKKIKYLETAQYVRAIGDGEAPRTGGDDGSGTGTGSVTGGDVENRRHGRRRDTKVAVAGGDVTCHRTELPDDARDHN